MGYSTTIGTDIKTLKIQGATNVALAVLDAINEASMKINFSNTDGYYKELKKTSVDLAYSRPNEPLAQNAIRFIFSRIENSPDSYRQKIRDYRQLLTQGKEKIISIGHSLIQNGGTYLTHCHSSTVTSLFIQAKKKGKEFNVFAGETRPLYQGRITAQELADAGIAVTQIVDGATPRILSGIFGKIGGIFIGADVLAKNGFVNKIGSLPLAITAELYSIPLFSVSSLLKYDPQEFSNSAVELRPETEIWPGHPDKVKLYNPSFDFIPYTKQVHIITEAGIISGTDTERTALSTYSFLGGI